MNIHILVIKQSDGTRAVEVFKSRDKMTAFRHGLEGVKATMFPPIPVPRSADGIMLVAEIINRIHVEGEEAVLDSMDEAET